MAFGYAVGATSVRRSKPVSTIYLRIASIGIMSLVGPEEWMFRRKNINDPTYERSAESISVHVDELECRITVEGILCDVASTSEAVPSKVAFIQGDLQIEVQISVFDEGLQFDVIRDMAYEFTANFEDNFPEKISIRHVDDTGSTVEQKEVSV